MTKVKQIEEMALIIHKIMPIGLELSAAVATDLYNAGYRKQSEGEWVLEREPNGKPYCFHCSVCDSDFHHIGIKVATNYCPNCGAKMKGGAE